MDTDGRPLPNKAEPLHIARSSAAQRTAPGAVVVTLCAGDHIHPERFAAIIRSRSARLSTPPSTWILELPDHIHFDLDLYERPMDPGDLPVTAHVVVVSRDRKNAIMLGMALILHPFDRKITIVHTMEEAFALVGSLDPV